MTSTYRNHLNEVLRRFGQGIGLDGCGLDESGGAQFGFDKVFVGMDLDEAQGQARLLSPIGRPGTVALGRLLDANLSQDGTVVARDAASGLVVLTLRLGVEGLDVPAFEAALGTFVAKVEGLRATLDEETSTGVLPPVTAPRDRGAQMRAGSAWNADQRPERFDPPSSFGQAQAPGPSVSVGQPTRMPTTDGGLDSAPIASPRPVPEPPVQADAEVIAALRHELGPLMTQAESLLASASAADQMVEVRDRLTALVARAEEQRSRLADGDPVPDELAAVIAPARDLVTSLQAALRAGTTLERQRKDEIAGRLAAAAKVPPAELYVERQESSACACHAFNAYLGGRAATTGEFEDWARIVAGGANPAALPPSISTGFEPFLVQEALQVMQRKGVVDGRTIGMQGISGSAGDTIAAVTLAPIEGDRLVVEVQTARDGRRSDHYVAFRKDANDRWWLLDSRSEDLANPWLPSKPDGSPIRWPVDPDVWLNDVARNNDLRRVVLIGAGIAPSGGHISVEEGVSGAMIKMSGRGIHSF
jgi:hypothetical protein